MFPNPMCTDGDECSGRDAQVPNNDLVTKMSGAPSCLASSGFRIHKTQQLVGKECLVVYTGHCSRGRQTSGPKFNATSRAKATYAWNLYNKIFTAELI